MVLLIASVALAWVMGFYQVRNLTTCFQNRTENAVNGVSFEFGNGEILGLVGESGSGKSALALTMLRLLPPGSRFTGEFLIDGKEVLGKSEGEFRRYRGRRLGIIFQETESALSPVFSIGKQLREALSLHEPDLSKEELHAGTMELLTKVGLPDPESMAAAYPHQLSGGMRQRVMIALAISGKPDLLVADEPTTALDVTIQAQILELLRSLAREMKMSLLLITHNLSIVANYCDLVLIMKNGKIIESGTVEEIFSRPKEDYTKSLLELGKQLESGNRIDRLKTFENQS